jgi:two-component system nitrate/nitrite response regulator NarL
MVDSRRRSPAGAASLTGDATSPPVQRAAGARVRGGSAAVRVVVASGRQLFGALVAEFLSQAPGVSVEGRTLDLAHARQLATASQAHVVVMDLELYRFADAVATGLLAPDAPYRVLVLAGPSVDGHAIDAMRQGVWGVVYQNAHPARLLRQVRAAAAGAPWEDLPLVAHLLTPRPHERTSAALEQSHPWLSRRERDLIVEVAAGATNADIARSLGLRPQTVKNRLSSIFDKLGVSTRLELALYAVHHELHQR